MGRSLPKANLMVSVICSTYNRPQCLRRLIDCMKAQTIPKWEMLVMMEADTEELKAEYLKLIEEITDPRIKWHFCERFNDWGYSVKEIGASLAEGDCLMFPADDAQYLPTYIEKLDVGADLIASDWFFGNIGSNVEVVPRIASIDVGGFVVKKTIFNEVKFFNKGSCGDGEFIVEVIRRGYEFKRVPEVLYIKS